ncbi:hypothetical protein [Rhodospirillum sp. A1_3_36]|uniref:hypothetical protein n=1 Tax=Rhodospirillum sp. A1_3_36 TaxID=3391666 RepID=UPI0039A6968B
MTTECSDLILPMPFTGNHTHPLASTCHAGVVQLATEAEVVSNPDSIKPLAVTPYTLGHYTGLVDQVATVEASDLLLVRDVSANKDVSYTFGALKDAVTPPQATTEVLGIIELATDGEVLAGIDAERAVTPAGLEVWADGNPSTETERGLIELATDAEVIAGTDTERAVTPSALATARRHTDATWFSMVGSAIMNGTGLGSNGGVVMVPTNLDSENPNVINGEFFVPVGGSGLWCFTGLVHYPHTVEIMNAYAVLMVNGEPNIFGSRSGTTYPTLQAMSSVSGIWPMEENDKVSIGVWCESGSDGAECPHVMLRGARIAI